MRAGWHVSAVPCSREGLGGTRASPRRACVGGSASPPVFSIRFQPSLRSRSLEKTESTNPSAALLTRLRTLSPQAARRGTNVPRDERSCSSRRGRERVQKAHGTATRNHKGHPRRVLGRLRLGDGSSQTRTRTRRTDSPLARRRGRVAVRPERRVAGQAASHAPTRGENAGKRSSEDQSGAPARGGRPAPRDEQGPPRTRQGAARALVDAASQTPLRRVAAAAFDRVDVRNQCLQRAPVTQPSETQGTARPPLHSSRTVPSADRRGQVRASPASREPSRMPSLTL